MLLMKGVESLDNSLGTGMLVDYCGSIGICLRTRTLLGTLMIKALVHSFHGQYYSLLDHLKFLGAADLS